MIKFNPNLEIFKDFVHFTKDSECIWVVFPQGGAGDLLASLINYHYVNTSAKYRGITDTGQVKFRASDQNYTNILLDKNLFNLDEDFFNQLIIILSKKNTNFSLLDQFIFSNHAWTDEYLSKILECFANCKIIRIIPKDEYESKIISWLGFYKNYHIISDINGIIPINTESIIDDSRVLTIYFSDLISPDKFNLAYDQIISHLNLPDKLIRFNFIQHWIDHQHEKIKPLIKNLSKNY
jgi:hypothetical protein